MPLLDRDEILQSIDSDDPNSIFIDPLLDRGQVGAVTVDLRLGYDFLVSILTRKPSIDLSHGESGRRRGIATYFQETRREIGDPFILYPNQIVLTTTLEYLSLPTTVMVDIAARSSYARLGIQTTTHVQPGFRGCVALELFNHGNTPVELRVGSRVCQARFFRSKQKEGYLNAGSGRKYYCSVRPMVSMADHDRELQHLIDCRQAPLT